MASEQAIANKAIAKAVTEVTKAAIQAMATAERPQSMMGPKIGSPAMKQPSFNCEADDKYSKLKNFRLEVNNIISTYNTPHAEELAKVKNWLGRKGLQLIELLTNAEKDGCNTLEGSFEILTNMFGTQLNKTIKSLQFCKLCRQNGENAEEGKMLRNGWVCYGYQQ